MLRIHEIKLKVGESLDEIPNKIIKKIGKTNVKLASYHVVRESIDARDKGEINLVYTVDFSISQEDGKLDDLEEEFINRYKNIRIEKAPDMSYQYAQPGQEKMLHRPVIVGFGPCGMFAALILSELGYHPIVIERGKSIEERVKDVNSFWTNGILDEESNVQFGEGGAGAFSDGKLTTQIKDARVRKVLEEFVLAGGAPDILYKQKPHIGTDVLRNVVINIRNKIIKNGGEILFQSKLTNIIFTEAHGNKRIKAVVINEKDEFETDNLILAIGHSARDTYRVLYGIGIPMEQKPFSIGVRIEHPQAMINEAQFGKEWRKHGLGAADYKLAHHCENGRGLYTFCMCPGGHVIAAASQEGCIVTNGMSYQSRDAVNANSGLLVDVRTDDFLNSSPLAGIEFQEKYERIAYEAGGSNYSAPAQKLGDFMSKARASKKIGSSPKVTQPMFPKPIPTYQPGVKWTDLTKCLPEFVVESILEAIPKFGRRIKGFDMLDSILTGVETRSSSPVRILRESNYMSQVIGLYPAGEGAGYAGGIVSAGVDGIKIEEEIIKKYQSK